MAFYRNPYPTVSTPTPPDHAAVINARLAATGLCVLDPGEYEIDDPILMPTGSRLEPSGPGRVVFTPTWAPAVGDADLATNYVIGVRGTLTATTTTLAATYGCDKITITVASTAAMSAGQWWYLSGNNGSGPPGDDALMSDGGDVLIQEWVQIASVTNGTTCVLASPLKQHHLAGKTLTLGTPIENVTIRGISIRAPGGTIAVGISAHHALNLRIDDYEIEGLSRAGVDMKACSGYVIEDLYSYGEANSWVLQDGCMIGSIVRPRGNQQGLRTHANGVPRGLVSHRNRCKWVDTIDPLFVRGCVGYRAWGGFFLRLIGGSTTDMDPALAYARDQELIDAGGPGFGIAWDGGPGPLDIAEFGFGCSITDHDVSNCKATGVHLTSPTYAVFLHDHFRMQITNLRVTNRGEAYDPAIADFANGINMRDTTGQISNLIVSGVYDAISTHNVYARFRCSTVLLEGQPGNGANAQYAVLMNTGGGERCEPEFKGLEINGYSGTEFTAGPDVATYEADWQLTWRDVNLDGVRADFVTLGKNNTGTPFTQGQIAQYDDAASAATGVNSRRIKTPAANARDVCVVLAESGTYCLVAPLPQVTVSAVVDGAVALGGMVAATTARQLTATATEADACGRALRKATGAATLLIGLK